MTSKLMVVSLRKLCLFLLLAAVGFTNAGCGTCCGLQFMGLFQIADCGEACLQGKVAKAQGGHDGIGCMCLKSCSCWAKGIAGSK